VLTWTVTDRATRIVFYGCLVLAAAALAPVLAGEVSLPLMVVVLVLVYQAWRLAMARHLTVRLDDSGITKNVGGRTWRLAWEQVTALTLRRYLGAGHLVVRTTDAMAWNASDKLFWKLGRNEAALQVPPAMLPQVRAFLAARGMELGPGADSVRS
jgi:hypothetical protein